jgi:hypothetical protein
MPVKQNKNKITKKMGGMTAPSANFSLENLVKSVWFKLGIAVAVLTVAVILISLNINAVSAMASEIAKTELVRKSVAFAQNTASKIGFDFSSKEQPEIVEIPTNASTFYGINESEAQIVKTEEKTSLIDVVLDQVIGEAADFVGMVEDGVEAAVKGIGMGLDKGVEGTTKGIVAGAEEIKSGAGFVKDSTVAVVGGTGNIAKSGYSAVADFFGSIAGSSVSGVKTACKVVAQFGGDFGETVKKGSEGAVKGMLDGIMAGADGIKIGADFVKDLTVTVASVTAKGVKTGSSAVVNFSENIVKSSVGGVKSSISKINFGFVSEAVNSATETLVSGAGSVKDFTVAVVGGTGNIAKSGYSAVGNFVEQGTEWIPAFTGKAIGGAGNGIEFVSEQIGMSAEFAINSAKNLSLSAKGLFGKKTSEEAVVVENPEKLTISENQEVIAEIADETHAVAEAAVKEAVVAEEHAKEVVEVIATNAKFAVSADNLNTETSEEKTTNNFNAKISSVGYEISGFFMQDFPNFISGLGGKFGQGIYAVENSVKLQVSQISEIVKSGTAGIVENAAKTGEHVIASIKNSDTIFKTFVLKIKSLAENYNPFKNLKNDALAYFSAISGTRQKMASPVLALGSEMEKGVLKVETAVNKIPSLATATIGHATKLPSVAIAKSNEIIKALVMETRDFAFNATSKILSIGEAMEGPISKVEIKIGYFVLDTGSVMESGLQAVKRGLAFAVKSPKIAAEKIGEFGKLFAFETGGWIKETSVASAESVKNLAINFGNSTKSFGKNIGQGFTSFVISIKTATMATVDKINGGFNYVDETVGPAVMARAGKTLSNATTHTGGALKKGALALANAPRKVARTITTVAVNATNSVTEVKNTTKVACVQTIKNAGESVQNTATSLYGGASSAIGDGVEWARITIKNWLGWGGSTETIVEQTTTETKTETTGTGTTPPKTTVIVKETTKPVTASELQTTIENAVLTLKNYLTVKSGLAVGGNLTVSGNLKGENELKITGPVSVKEGDLAVGGVLIRQSGDLYIPGTLTSDGVAKFTGEVDFTGATVKGLPAGTTIINSAPITYTISGSTPSVGTTIGGTFGGVTYDFSVGRNITVGEDADILGDLYVRGSSDLGSTTFRSAVTMDGGFTSAGTSTATNLVVSGNAEIGYLTASLSPRGNNEIDLGAYDRAFRNVYVSGTLFGGVDLTSVTSNILPATADTYDIGSYTNTWNNIYSSGSIYAESFYAYGTGAMVIPVGATGDRPSGDVATGSLRYNTTSSGFEGYNGSAWSGLGGVIDVDQDTYILAELTSGSDNDTLYLFTAGTERGVVDSSGLTLGTGSASSTFAQDFWRLNADETNTSGTFYIGNDGSVYTSGTIYASQGTVLLPSIAFGVDTDTGIYSPGANAVDLTVNGALTMRVGVGATYTYGTLAPGSAGIHSMGAYSVPWLNVFASGTAYLANIQADNYIDVYDGTTSSTLGKNFLRIAGSNNDASGTLYLDNDGSIYSSGTLNFATSGTSTFAGGVQALAFDSTATSTMEGLIVNGNVGIGQAPAGYRLSVNGVGYFTNGVNAGGGNVVIIDNWALALGTGTDSYVYYNTLQTADSLIITTSADSNTMLIVETADSATNFAHALENDPTIFIHSSSTTNTGLFAKLNYNELSLTDYTASASSTLTANMLRLNQSSDYASGTFYLDNDGSIFTSGTIYASAGSAATPSITFAGDSDTGFFQGTNNIAMTLGGTQYYQFAADYLYNTGNIAPFQAGLSQSIIGRTTDVATGVGVIVNNLTALTTTGAKLLSIRNNSVEKAFFDLNGELTIADKNGTVASSTLGRDFLRIGEKDGYASGALYIDNDGSIFTSGTIYASAGAVATPSITFIGNTVTGIYQESANYLDFAVNGIRNFYLTPSGTYIDVSLAPSSNNTKNNGAYALAWKDIYASGTAYLGSTSIWDSTDASTGTLYNTQATSSFYSQLTSNESGSYAYIFDSAVNGDAYIMNWKNQNASKLSLSASGTLQLYNQEVYGASSTQMIVRAGAGQTTDKMLDIRDNSDSSLFSVNPTIASFNQPMEIAVAGDVGFAYDLEFTNPDAAYIRSQGPLYIEGGDINQNTDLTLRARNYGEVVVADSAMRIVRATSTASETFRGLTIDIDDVGTMTGTMIGLDVDMSGVASGTVYSALFQSGMVGIGTTAPGGTLAIVSTSSTLPLLKLTSADENLGGSAMLQPGIDFSATGTFRATSTDAVGNSAFVFDTFGSGNTATLLSIRSDGTDKFTFNANSTSTFAGSLYLGTGTPSGSHAQNGSLYVTGDAEIGGTCSDVGGGCADLAEVYDSADEVEPGDVVIVSSASEEGLPTVEKSKSAYAGNIAGIVSTSPGIIFGAGGSVRIATAPSSNPLRPAVALAGRVPVKVSLENGSIMAGDLLVSASEEGHAMKYDSENTTGGNIAVIGVALESYDGQGEGDKILVMLRSGFVTSTATQNSTLTAEQGNDGEIVVGENTYGDIIVQSIAGVTGDWSISSDGIFIGKEMKTKEMEAEGYKVKITEERKTVGVAKILAGEEKVKVENAAAVKDAKIFVTFRGNPGGAWWISGQEEGWFEISLSSGAIADVNFDYWIISIVDETTPAETPETPSEPLDTPETPSEPPTDVPSETPAPAEEPDPEPEVPAETPEVPSEPTETPSEEPAPEETPETPFEPLDTPEAPAETPSEPPADVPSETPENPSDVPLEPTP